MCVCVCVCVCVLPRKDTREKKIRLIYLVLNYSLDSMTPGQGIFPRSKRREQTEPGPLFSFVTDATFTDV